MPPPDPPLNVDHLSQELRDAALLMNTAHERAEERDLVASAHDAVDRLVRRYRELFDAAPAAERERIERLLGRRLTDVRRQASLLPRAGAGLESSTPDRRVRGPSLAEERRITGVSWGRLERTGAADSSDVRVGGEIESWCGKCGGLTHHTVAAMVDGEPRQVVCDVCHSRHAHRTGPARRATERPASAPPESPRPKTAAEVEAQKRAERTRALAREIASADDVRPFDPSGSYRPGDIILHPEFGRGKVENVLRSSLLVRFPTGGLKSLMLK